MRRGSLVVAAFLGLLCAAPTVGDVGGCGDPVKEAAPSRYVADRKQLECDRCRECNARTQRCARACDPKKPSDVELPATCRPLEHDVDVCLRALEAIDCDDFAASVADEGPRSPDECLFCRVAPVPSAPTFADGGS